ncbi:cysteine-rich repeat secretory protein 12-like protein [Tanacetum coccineum]
MYQTPSIRVTILSLIFCFISVSAANSLVYYKCSQLYFDSMTLYESNVNSLFNSLVDSAAVCNFNTLKISPLDSSRSNDLYGLFQCRGDLNFSNCRDCVTNSLNQLKTTCPVSTSGALQSQGCFVKYDNTSFLGVEDKMEVYKRCGPSVGYNSDGMSTIDKALTHLTTDNQQYFRAGGYGGVNGVAQCTQDITLGACEDCLLEARGRLRSECETSSWGDMYLGSCYIRYGNQDNSTSDYNDNDDDDRDHKRKRKPKLKQARRLAITIGSSVVGVVSSAGIVAAGVIIYKKRKEAKEHSYYRKRVYTPPPSPKTKVAKSPPPTPPPPPPPPPPCWPPPPPVHETFENVRQEKQALIDVEDEAIHIILTGIDNDIYSTVDACDTAQEMWIAIERLKKCENINRQDVEMKLFCEFEWSRFVTIVKQAHDLKTISYHTLFDILKQHQNEVNELRAETLARTTNPQPLVAATHGKTTENPSKNDRIIRNNRQKGKNENQRAVVIAGNRESVGQRVVQQTGIKLPQGKDVDMQEGSSWGQLSAEEYNRLIDSNEEPKDQELEAHHTFMAKIQEVVLDAAQDSGPSYDTKPLGKDDKHVTPNSTYMCSNEGEVDQDAEKNNDERKEASAEQLYFANNITDIAEYTDMAYQFLKKARKCENLETEPSKLKANFGNKSKKSFYNSTQPLSPTLTNLKSHKLTLFMVSFNVVATLNPPNADCVVNAVNQLKTTCPLSVGGSIQLDGSFLKYDNTPFFGVENTVEVLKRCGPLVEYNSDILSSRDEALVNLIAGNGKYFHGGDYGSIRGVAQSVQDLSLSDCQDCLSEASGRLRSQCETSSWGDMFLGKCYIRYHDRDIGHSSNNNSKDDGGGNNSKLIAVIASVIGVILAILGAAVHKKSVKHKTAEQLAAELAKSVSVKAEGASVKDKAAREKPEALSVKAIAAREEPASAKAKPARENQKQQKHQGKNQKQQV